LCILGKSLLKLVWKQVAIWCIHLVLVGLGYQSLNTMSRIPWFTFILWQNTHISNIGLTNVIVQPPKDLWLCLTKKKYSKTIISNAKWKNEKINKNKNKNCSFYISNYTIKYLTWVWEYEENVSETLTL